MITDGAIGLLVGFMLGSLSGVFCFAMVVGAGRYEDGEFLEDEEEIVRCKDCKYADDDGVCQNSVGLVIQDDDDFCSRAERKLPTVAKGR